MKTLLLLRHAKSSRKDASLADHDRPLSKRGVKNASRMGTYLRDEGLFPDRVLCSSATRAVETWESASNQLGRAVPTTQLRALYTADDEALLQTVRGGAPEDSVVLLVGHNPALEELAESLVGSGDPAAVEAIHRKFPTGSLAVIRFDTENWAEIAPESGELERFVRPQLLPS
jgi:phosphohistidine phosphatase